MKNKLDIRIYRFWYWTKGLDHELGLELIIGLKINLIGLEKLINWGSMGFRKISE